MKSLLQFLLHRDIDVDFVGDISEEILEELK